MLFGAQLQDSPEDVHGSFEWNRDVSTFKEGLAELLAFIALNHHADDMT